MSQRSARTLAWLGALGLALAAWLAWPVRERGGARGALRVCLLDVSASVVRTRPDWRAFAMGVLDGEASDSQARGEDLLVLAYARDVVRCFGPENGGALEPADCLDLARGVRDDASDADAVLAALESDPEVRGRVGALTWVGDRSYTSKDPGARLAELAAAGARVRWIDAPPQQLADVALVRLQAPDEVEVGAPLSLVAELALSGPRGGEVVLDVRASGATVAQRSLSVALDPAATARSVRVDLGPAGKGATLVRAQARLGGGDPVPENDAASAIIRSRGALELAFVGADASLEVARHWAACVSALPGLAATAVAPADLAGSLAACDAIVSFDVDPRALPRDLTAAFVRAGGAWLACGGYDLLAGWSAAREGELAADLPLLVDDDASPRDVVLLVDGSGSMAGDAFEQVRRSVPALIAAARASDRIALRFFTDRLEPELELGRGPQASSRALLDARVPGGPTDVARALDQLARERGSSAPALALLLTDGRDQRARGATAQTLRALRGALAAARVELAVVAVGASADLDYLAELAGGAHLVRRGGDETSLRDAFERELARGRVRDDGSIELVTTPARGRSLADELRSALAEHALPALERSIRSRARVGDEVVLATAAGEPALALRVVGGGLTATWTSWPSDEWAPRWRDACAELAPLLRGLARTRGGAPRVEARIDGGELELDGVPGDWPLELDAVATELATGEVVGSARIALPPSSPGTDPRSLRRGSWSPESSFAAGTCELALAGANGWSSRLPFTLPTAEEFSSSPRRIASSPVAAATESGASVRAGHRAAPWLLGVSLAALAAGAALGALRQSFQAAGRSGR